jgi:hypothetical protein
MERPLAVRSVQRISSARRRTVEREEEQLREKRGSKELTVGERQYGWANVDYMYVMIRRTASLAWERRIEIWAKGCLIHDESSIF